MITLHKRGLLYRLFLFPLTVAERCEHQEQTNFCFLFGTLVVRLPCVVVLFAIFSPVFGLLSLGSAIEESIKRRRAGKPLPQMPSILHVWWETVHGRLCPTVRFE